MSIDIKKELDEGKGLIMNSDESLKYVQTPIGKAHYKAGLENESKKHYTDRIVCKDCGESYTRSNFSKHRQTKVHKLAEKINNKWKAMIFNV